MIRRAIIIALLGLFLVPLPASASARRSASITGADMIGVDVGSSCGVQMDASLADVGKALSVDFQIHSAIYGTTIHVWKSLSAGQMSVSATMTVCSSGDTWDRLDVVLHQARKVLDTETVVKTIVCAPR